MMKNVRLSRTIILKKKEKSNEKWPENVFLESERFITSGMCLRAWNEWFDGLKRGKIMEQNIFHFDCCRTL